MSEIIYIEDIFKNFFKLVTSQQLLLTRQDISAAGSLYNYCDDDSKYLTANQANYLLKILSRYQKSCADLDLDYQKDIENPQWRKKFRTIDLSKKIFVEVDNQKKIWICLKFPFSLKEVFDKEIRNEKSNQENNRWDHERKIRMISAYRHNIIQINDFVTRFDFEIDDTFLHLVSQVEEIWQQQDNIYPYSEISDGQVCLVNAVSDAVDYFTKHKKSDLDHDLFLAKSMNFPAKLNHKPNTLIETISSSANNQFWIKENSRFFEIYKKIQGKACVVIDRNTKNVLGWLKKLVSDAELCGVKSDLKICFRDSSDTGLELNTWIKEQGLGGKVNEGKIYVFLHKPPKWLFKEKIDVKIIGTNCYVPPLSDSIVASWMLNHPCLCYLGDVKPTEIRDYKIVNV